MSSQTALIVDDSKLARITLQRLLEKRNFQVRLAESASEALSLLETELPDIIFMDHLMPEIDGFEAMRRIKANPTTQHIPVVMCTGKEGTGDYDSEAKAIGAAATLSKPPELEQLNQVLEEAQQAAAITSVAPVAPPTAQPTTAPAAADTGLEERLVAALQQALDDLRHEAAEPIAALKLEQKNQFQIVEQKLEALWAALPREDHQQGVPSALVEEIQSQLTRQQESAAAELEQVSGRLNPALAQLEQLSSQVTDLAGRFDQVSDRLEQVAPQLEQSASLADDFKSELATLDQRLQQQAQQLEQVLQDQDQRPAQSSGVTADDFAALQAQLEQRLADQHAELARIQTSLEERLASVSQPAEQASVNDAELRAALEQQIIALDERIGQQLQALQAQSTPNRDTDTEERMVALEAALRQTESQLREELRSQAGAQAQATTAPADIDYAALEQRATDAALTAVEETFDALIAHKVEQVRNNLALELKAQVLRPAGNDDQPDTDAPDAASAAVAAEEVRRLAQEAVSDELDQASEHLVMKITDALQERVEQSQQELLTRQEVFEQERAALRRQIKQLRRSLLMISAGAGLLAVVAFVTAIMT